MLIELFIFFEIVMLGFFVTAFFTKQEILWALSALLSGVLMFSSYNIEYYIYQFNSSISAYSPIMTSFNYPYLMGINMVFFILTLILAIFDIFDKYGNKIAGESKR